MSLPWRLGTMGFGYDDWSGPFYPRSLKTADRLSFYAKHFNAVELDTTFHAAPDAGRVRRWAVAVPDHFRFCVKTPRAVTHDQPLDRSADAMLRFLDAVREMGDKLGAVLLQFPPHFLADSAGKLDDFLARMPRDVRLAVELRNRTWGTQATLDLLRRHGCCLVAAEYLTRPLRLLVTADFLYVRWVGQHGRFPSHTTEQVDVTESLQWWKAELERVTPGVKETYGFFNNDFAGYGVGTCNRFKGMLGLPASEGADEGQGELFG